MKTEILTNLNNLPAQLKALCEECEQFADLDRDPVFPFRLSASYAAKILNCGASGGGLFRQAFPDRAERRSARGESDDPLSETGHMPVPGLVHRYRDRVLLLLTDNCDMHCRHCFRRAFSGKGDGTLTDAELDAAADYVDCHPEVHEIILSGGDPLTLTPSKLAAVFRKFLFPGRRPVFRVGTRVPVVSPDRITPALLEALQPGSAVWIMLQANHPDELDSHTLRALGELRSAGLTILNQTVLLKGINDNPAVLIKLCHLLVENGIKPYYIFQGDLAYGTSHFRLPLEKGWQIMKELRLKLSGVAMPVYAVDLPGGGGKIPLTENYLLRKEKGNYVFSNPEGGEYRYPVE